MTCMYHVITAPGSILEHANVGLGLEPGVSLSRAGSSADAHGRPLAQPKMLLAFPNLSETWL